MAVSWHPISSCLCWSHRQCLAMGSGKTASVFPQWPYGLDEEVGRESGRVWRVHTYMSQGFAWLNLPSLLEMHTAGCTVQFKPNATERRLPMQQGAKWNFPPRSCCVFAVPARQRKCPLLLHATSLCIIHHLPCKKVGERGMKLFSGEFR